MFLLKMLLSLVITNWLYAETCYFIPGFDKFARDFVNSVELPRHDQWPAIANSPAGQRLGKDISTAVDASGFGALSIVKAFKDPRLVATWTLGEVPTAASNLWSSVGRDMGDMIESSFQEMAEATEEGFEYFSLAQSKGRESVRRNLPGVRVPSVSRFVTSNALRQARDFVQVDSVEDIEDVLNFETSSRF